MFMFMEIKCYGHLVIAGDRAEKVEEWVDSKEIKSATEDHLWQYVH